MLSDNSSSGTDSPSANPQTPSVKPLPVDDYKSLLESFAQAVWETDPLGLVVADSPSWRAYTGQTLEQWLGEGWVSAIHPDDRPYALHQWQQAVAQQRPVNAEFRLRSPDGGWRWTNVRAAATVAPDGRVQKWVGLNIDIGERKRAEEHLHQSATNLQVVLDNSPAAIGLLKAVHDPRRPEHITDFRLAVGNEKLAQFFGQPLKKLLNGSAQRFASLLWGSETLPKLRQIYQDKTYQYEEKRLSLAGQDRWLALSAVSQDGGVIITGLDITELKQTQARQQVWLDELETARHSVEALATLRASLDQRTDLMRAFSHDLRANFSLIVGGLQLFDSADSEQDRAQMVAIVARNVQQATGLLTDLLDLSRLESGQQQRTIATFDVRTVFEELNLGLQSSARERGLALQLVGPDTLVVENDRQLVYRLVQNVLVNALKYTQQGGVTLDWASTENGWWFEVADTGPGLPPVLLEGLTTSEPLEAVPASGPPRTGHWLAGRGEGLGLRIVRELAGLLEAQFQVRSEAGVGTQFRVIFPLTYR